VLADWGQPCRTLVFQIGCHEAMPKSVVKQLEA